MAVYSNQQGNSANKQKKLNERKEQDGLRKHPDSYHGRTIQGLKTSGLDH